MKDSQRLCLCAIIWFVICAIDLHADDAETIIRQRCGQCHVGQTRAAELRIDRAAGIEPAVHEELLERIEAKQRDVRMPPEGKRLRADEIETIRLWLAAGGKWAVRNTGFSRHWSMQPLPDPIASAIDVHVIGYVEANGLRLTAIAPREVLIRRLSFDLRGIPPTIEERNRFLTDTRRDAYRRLVDRWLAAPEFAERWATHWLDLARYADTDGGYLDGPRHGCWQYRDWVIESIRSDQPIDEFTIAQLAGDLLPGNDWNNLIAASFHRNSAVNKDACADPVEERFNRLVDRVNTTAAVWMGLTLQCAQCHDHKLEPISSREYYQLMAFFADADEVTTHRDPQRYQALTRQESELTTALGERTEALDSSLDEAAIPASEPTEPNRQSRFTWTWPILGMLAAAGSIAVKVRVVRIGGMLCAIALFAVTGWIASQGVPVDLSAPIKPLSKQEKIKQALGSDSIRQKLLSERLEVQQELEQTSRIDSFQNVPVTSHVHQRGQFSALGIAVEPKLPDWFGQLQTGGRATRLDLARWLVSDRNPLTPRVIAHRMLSRLFGHPILGEANNLGTSGNDNSWTQLVDHIAADLVDSNWSRQRLVRRIVNSSVYKSNIAISAGQFSLQRRRRLDAEEIRDTCLVIGGAINRTGGRNASPAAAASRRSVFQTRSRQYLPPLLQVFDLPTHEKCCVARSRTDSVLQSLAMLNDPLTIGTAHRLAKDVLAERLTPRQSIEAIYLKCVGREPDEVEAADCESWIKELLPRIDSSDPQQQAWAALARVLLAHDETLHRP